MKSWPLALRHISPVSDEDKQQQPNSDQFENTQIRLEDGTVIFTPNLFGSDISIADLTYKMAAFDGGLKYHGYSLDGEYFLRWLDHFKGPDTPGLAPIFSNGFQMQASAMVLPKTFQVYLGGSALYGKYGNPWDFRAAVNWFLGTTEWSVGTLNFLTCNNLRWATHWFPLRSEVPDPSSTQISRPPFERAK